MNLPVRREPDTPIGDPCGGSPKCRECGGLFFSDETMVRVKRFGWLRGFRHKACG